MRHDIAIYGAGGLGREVACLIRKINEAQPEGNERWNLLGFFDDGQPAGTRNEYGEVLGNIDTLNRYDKELAVAIAIGSPNAVKSVYEKIENPKIYFPNLIAPNTQFFDIKNVTIGIGNIICPYSVLSCHVSLGKFNILNVYTQLGHDAILADFNVLMPSTNISGGVHIGMNNFFGVKSTVLQMVEIGNNTRIGTNSVVIRNTKDGNLYMGNPARLIKL